MYVKFDRDTCIGTFNCTHEWEKFIADRTAGKATLVDSTEDEPGIYIRDVPDGEESDAQWAARACPVDAITIYDENDTQVAP